MTTGNSALQIFGTLVNIASQLTYGVSTPTEVESLLDRTDYAIRVAFGDKSEYLTELRRLKLYRPNAKKNNRESYFVKEKVQLEGLLNKITTYLELGDYSSAKVADDVILAQPMFGKPLPVSNNWSDIFVLMPFTDGLKPVYTDHILPIAESFSLSCKRGDDFFSDKAIVHEIWSAIYHSKICIAECTGKNANVFYELGIAHTLGRRCVLLAQSIDDIPFDLRHLRTIVYDYTPRGVKLLEDGLRATLKNLLE